MFYMKRTLYPMNRYLIDFQVSTCRDEFRDIPRHTMCRPDPKKASRWGVSEAEKNDIVKQHNMLRGTIEPPATDLLTMVSLSLSLSLSLSQQN